MAVSLESRPSLFPTEPLALVTHVGRDVLANAAHFATVPKAVYEYVSNSIDAAPPARPCHRRASSATVGRPVRVREIVAEEPTDAPDGTVVMIEDLHRGTRVDRSEIVRYLQRQLGRHLVRHQVMVEGERVVYVEPEATEEQRFACSEAI